ncbi:MAG: T9SS type A sorting domain-containing protein, partial [Flavobacteriaceae bacterium]|nr:T9SS type A sorting domain-containing protein [Flavobacteriaceae bacterium]
KGLDVVNKVVVYDLSGRLVYESNAVASSAFSATIGISELQSGSYLVVLKNNEKTIVSKQLVKE